MAWRSITQKTIIAARGSRTSPAGVSFDEGVEALQGQPAFGFGLLSLDLTERSRRSLYVAVRLAERNPEPRGVAVWPVRPGS